MIDKNEMFELANEIIKIEDLNVKEGICYLSSLLNQEKNDSYYIPKALVYSYNNVIDEVKTNADKITKNRIFKKNVLFTKESFNKITDDTKKKKIITEIRKKILNLNRTAILSSGKARYTECENLYFSEEGKLQEILQCHIADKDYLTNSECLVEKLMSMDKNK